VRDVHRAHDASTLGLSQDGIAGRLQTNKQTVLFAFIPFAVFFTPKDKTPGSFETGVLLL
jgi:hypothetical protein